MTLAQHFVNLTTIFNACPHDPDLDTLLDILIEELERLMIEQREDCIFLTWTHPRHLRNYEGVNYLLSERGYKLEFRFLTAEYSFAVSLIKATDGEHYTGLTLNPSPRSLWF